MNAGAVVRCLCAAALAATVAACAGTTPSATSSPSAQAENRSAGAPRTVNRNLSGYSVAFKQGYVAGCDSASGTRSRDEGRYKTDLDYTMGWNDGFSVCRR